LIEEIRLEHTEEEAILNNVNGRNEQTKGEKAPYKNEKMPV